MSLPPSAFGALKRLVAMTSPDTAQIRRLAAADDDAGGWSSGYTDHGPPLPCRVAMLGATRPSERVYADRLQDEASVEITLPAGTDVKASDQIVVGSVTYEVVGVVPPRSYEVRTRVTAKLISPAEGG